MHWYLRQPLDADYECYHFDATTMGDYCKWVSFVVTSPEFAFGLSSPTLAHLLGSKRYNKLMKTSLHLNIITRTIFLLQMTSNAIASHHSRAVDFLITSIRHSACRTMRRRHVRGEDDTWRVTWTWAMNHKSVRWLCRHLGQWKGKLSVRTNTKRYTDTVCRLGAYVVQNEHAARTPRRKWVDTIEAQIYYTSRLHDQ